MILSQTLQAVLNPRHVLGELLRIGGQAIRVASGEVYL